MSEETKQTAETAHAEEAEATAAQAGETGAEAAAPAASADKKPAEKAEAPKKEKAKKEKKVSAEEFAKVQKELEETRDRLLRTTAEYDNFRKRTAKEKDAAFSNGVAHALTALLPVLDTLDMAAAAPTEDENYKKGVLLTLDKADSCFESLHIEEIEAQDKEFDPNMMNAVMQDEADETHPSGTVTKVFQKGYKLGDHIIRHATVVVAK